MSDRVWNGATADFYTATDWSGGVAPVPGDEADIYAGDVLFIGSEGKLDGKFDVQDVFLGSTSSRAPAEITSEAATFGPFFYLNTSNLNEQQQPAFVYAEFLSLGETNFAGTLDVEDANFSIVTESAASTAGGDFVLQTDGTISVEEATLDVSGRLDLEGEFAIGVESALVNSGTIDVETAHQPAFSSGEESAISGGGTIAVELGGVALIGGTVSKQTFVFDGPGGVISLSDLAGFAGTITHYGTGDLIDLAGVAATAANFDVTTGILTATEAGRTVATLHVSGPTVSGALTVTSDDDGGAVVELPNSTPLENITISAADEAMGSNVVRATLTTHAGVPITGAGIKVGIISDSFNDLGGANADAAGGFLPANANGTSAVDVIQDDPAGNGEDEGRAMAELVHQVAPGAQLYFYDDEGGDTGIAAGIGSMVADGVNIIVDDVSSPDEPFFQIAGPYDTAIESAMASGVSYFTSATNYGDGYYQASFTKTATTSLTGAPSGTNYAQTFSNGTNYQPLIFSGSTNIDLQWDAPFPTTLSGTSPTAMQMTLLDSQTGAVVAQSQQTTSTDGTSFTSEPEIYIAGVAAGSYVLEIYQTAAEAAATPVSMFKYILFGAGGAAAAIGDSGASTGSGAEHGHDLVPGVNTVAATSYTNAPDFADDDVDEPFSANGPGELLFDSNGDRLATPISDGKPDFTAPDGVDVSSDLSGFQPFYGTSAAAPDAAGVAALMLQANTSLETDPAQVTSDLETSAVSLGLPASQQGSGLVQAVGAVDLALQTACFAGGTRLLTTRGERAVEDVRIGDVMITADGARAPVRWIGHRRVNCRRHPDRESVQPVRIGAGAFGDACPHRDLVLSPDHAVFLEGALIPIKCLVNGTTIAQAACEEITYWHVELARHDVILAEGLPCESYLDTGNRASLAGAGRTMQLHPQFFDEDGEPIWEAMACAPLRIAGAAVARAAALVQRRAIALGSGANGVLPSRAMPDGRDYDLAELLRPAWYLAANPDVAAAGMSAAAHYLRYGRNEGRLPCPGIDLVRALGLVDPATVVFTMGDVVAAGADVVAHFCTQGWRELRRPNLYFETGWYRAAHGVPSGVNPLLHYLLEGEPGGLPPGPHFDPAWYRRRHGLAPTSSPLAHYLQHRRRQPVSPRPDFDVASYAAAHRATLRPGRDVYAHFLAVGQPVAAPARVRAA